MGCLVLVCLQPYRQITIATYLSHKHAKCYYGPFKVLEQVGAIAYRLELAAGCKMLESFLKNKTSCPTSDGRGFFKQFILKKILLFLVLPAF